MPTTLFHWIRLLVNAGAVEVEEMDGEVIVPVDFDLLPSDPAAAAAAPPPPTPGQTVDPAAPPVVRPPVEIAAAPDAGVEALPDAGTDSGLDGGGDAGPDAADDAGADTGNDAGPRDAGVPEPRDAGAPQPVASTGPRDAGAPGLRDPLSAAGGVSKIASKDPNVQVLIASDRLRKHELGAAFGRLLTTIPEWRSFFDGTGIDPVRDLDHLLIAGPQFRDSRKVVAVMDYNLSEARIRQAIDVVVERSDPKGAWLDDAPIPAAQARAHNGDRIFAMVPAKRLLAVLPADQKAQLEKLGGTKGFNRSSPAGIVLSLVTPARAFRGLPVSVPKELKWLRLSVTPLEGGGADVVLELMDETEELASRHAKELDAELEALRKPDLGILAGLTGGIELFGKVSFETAGPLVRAKGHLTRQQLNRIIVHAENILSKQGGKVDPPKKAREDDPY